MQKQKTGTPETDSKAAPKFVESKEINAVASKGKEVLEAKPERKVFTELNKEFIDTWLEALDKEIYPRCNGAFYKDGAVCALGVGLAIAEGLSPEDIAAHKGHKGYPGTMDNNQFMNGLRHKSNNDIVGGVVNKNDAHQLPWPEIAKWIRKNLKQDI